MRKKPMTKMKLAGLFIAAAVAVLTVVLVIVFAMDPPQRVTPSPHHHHHHHHHDHDCPTCNAQPMLYAAVPEALRAVEW